MSGPYRFNQQDSRSPLDRPQQNLFPAGQAPSFKTNVNRSKTKKWVEAKPYSYDGDDWGEYDEYDEYGAEQAPPPPQPAAVTNLRQPGSRFDQSSRSFTDPQQGALRSARRNSFEAGEEHRSFSSGTFPLQQSQQSQQAAPSKPAGQRYYAQRQASAAESDISDTPQHRPDFEPAALPPPLQTKISPTPGSATGSPLNPKYPVQKGSIGQVDSPGAISPQDHAPSSSAKPLPFIRPADIYKRFEEERQGERAASVESSRPSLDSVTRAKDEAPSEPSSGNLGKGVSANPPKPLESVPEGKDDKSSSLPDYGAAAPRGHESQPDFALPQVRRISAFDSDFWSNDGQPQAESSHVSAKPPPDDQGFRSVVDQAFTRSDDQRSMPPTPISRQYDLSRSNTESTSGISPIMSRVPSSATSALRNRNNAGVESSTPVIAEELSEAGTPSSSRPTSSAVPSALQQIARKPSPISHSHNLSSTSLPRSGLATPNQVDSPARSPAIEPQKFALEPETAQYSMLSPTSPDSVEGYTTREADIASAIKLNPTGAAPELGAAEMESQHAFLASHQSPGSPISDAASRSRSESPNKGRIHELAGKFGDVTHSRRGSTQSNTSRHSIQSWERSPEASRPSSPTKTALNKPASPTKEDSSVRPEAAREASFRPKLPGQWESYATNATTNPTPSVHGDKDVELEDGKPTTAAPPVTSPLDEVDLTPTTAKHPVLVTDPSKSTSNPLSALKAAGTAMGEAIQASAGLGSSSNHPSQGHDEQAQGQYHGDVYSSRPLQLDRTVSSDSSIPPTPPAKDTPELADVPPPPPLKPKSPETFASSSNQQTPVKPDFAPKSSSDISEHEEESDRLRKEIVASLDAPKASQAESSGMSLPSPTVPTANRASSILPSEYESYWAGGDHASPRPSNDFSNSVSEHAQVNANVSPDVPTSATTQQPDSTKPPLINQFSWEGDKTPLVSPEGQAQAGTDAQISSIPDVGKETVSSTGQQPEEEKPSQPLQGIPEHYFGPTHVAAVTKPDEPDIAIRSPTPPHSEKVAAGLELAETNREASPPPGLHVVNTATDPEAVDMPPRLSAETSLASQPPVASPKEAELPPPPKESTEKWPVAGAASGAPSTQDQGAKSPTSDKPLGFRDIVTMKSSTDRIASYNKTRDYWASADHGLNDWIASAMAANPQLATQPAQYRPTVTAGSPTHHRTTGSLSLFGKKDEAGNAQAPGGPYYDQHGSTPSQMPSTPMAPGASAVGGGASGGKSASQQMQSKGKDLLHTAGVLGGKGLGKGMSSAKGLFAKGKSRFKGGSSDKV